MKRMNFLVAPLMLLASCGSSDGAAPNAANEHKALPAEISKTSPPPAENSATFAPPTKIDRRLYPGFYAIAELLAKGAVVVNREELMQLLRGARISRVKEASPGPSWQYRFQCDGTGVFESGGAGISQESFSMTVTDDIAFFSFTDRQNKRELKIIKLGTQNSRFFLSYGNGVAVEIDLGRSTDNLGSFIKC